MDFNDAQNRLVNIKSIGIPSIDIDTTLNKINNLNSSREAFKNAEEYLNRNDYGNAIAQYKKVIEEDKNYEEANKQISIIEPKYQQQLEEQKHKIEMLQSEQLITVQSAKIAIQSSQYKSLYPDMLQAIIKNNSPKTVRSMKVGFLGFDANGYPKKIETWLNFDNTDYEFIGNAEDVNIVSSAVFGEDVGWKLDEAHGLSKILACVKSATFYDGNVVQID